MDAVPICCGEERAEWENLLVDLRSYPHLCSQAVFGDQKNETPDASNDNEFHLQGVWDQPRSF